MIVLIPLGGTGERFKKNGYKEPKALINVLGKPILYYLLDSIVDNIDNIDFIYIPYNIEYNEYRLEARLMKDYPKYKFKFLQLTTNTRGAGETVFIALNLLKNINDTPILCMDSDNFYTCNIIEKWTKGNNIFTIKDTCSSPIYSYVKIDNIINNNIINNNIITDIIEKEKISDYACCGAYGFASFQTLLKYSMKIIDENIRMKDEFYISTIIKEMIKDNIIFNMNEINVNDWHCLGTPIQVRLFCNNYPRISSLNNSIKIKPLRICFDLDNTLVSYPTIENDYTMVEPIIKNINMLRYLKNFGHTIIIYTARRMRTHSGNIGKILYDVGKITFDTLEKYNIPFDEIYFGKPYADVYIDDLALNCYENIEKSLGFYNDTIKPRDFNELKSNIINIFEKTSDDLSGEIYYYNNIPNTIKDLFPLLIDSDIYNKWYKMEKINGISVSTLYTSELLTIDCMKHIMNSINRIHKCSNNNDNDINIYNNYCIKLKQRYNSFNYNELLQTNTYALYCDIYTQLQIYEEKNKGIKSVIHGDTVLTNILINNFGKIKFIDMRGKIGDITTIYGDSMYDWAKLYQSLIGYDIILMDKSINESYQDTMVDTFKTFFIKMYSDEYFYYLKYIVKSLLLSLIPLHNNSKCIKYYNLLNCKYLI